MCFHHDDFIFGLFWHRLRFSVQSWISTTDRQIILSVWDFPHDCSTASVSCSAIVLNPSFFFCSQTQTNVLRFCEKVISKLRIYTGVKCRSSSDTFLKKFSWRCADVAENPNRSIAIFHTAQKAVKASRLEFANRMRKYSINSWARQFQQELQPPRFCGSHGRTSFERTVFHKWNHGKLGGANHLLDGDLMSLDLFKIGQFALCGFLKLSSLLENSKMT